MVISTFALSHLDTHGRYLGDTPRGSTAGAFAVTYPAVRGGAQRYGDHHLQWGPPALDR